MAKSAQVVPIASHPRYKWHDRETSDRSGQPTRASPGRILSLFEAEAVYRRYGEKLEALNWSEIKEHRGRYHVYVQIAVGLPAPPIAWLTQLRLVIDDPIKGCRQMPVSLAVNRGPCEINPRTSVRFDLYPKADDWLADYQPDYNATITVTTANGRYRLNGNLRHLLSYGR